MPALMVTVELDTCGTPEPAVSEADLSSSLSSLLDRCAEENIRNVSLRFPAVSSKKLEECLRPIVTRPFRFLAWFPTPPSATLADLFLANKHRLTLAATVMPDGRALRGLLENEIYAMGEPWQVNLFLALPHPALGMLDNLDKTPSRQGSNITLGMGWADPYAGPDDLAGKAERRWAEVLAEQAIWWTERGVTIHLACGLPLCMSTTEQLGALAMTRIKHPLASCTPGLIMTTNGFARACPLLPADGWTPVPAGVTLKDLRNLLIERTRFFASFCNRSDEQSCRSRATRACGGGCLAHNASLWQGSGGQG